MKKGFTLIELLAVIIILAIVALISTPIVLNVVEGARKSLFERTAEGLVGTIESYHQGLLVNNEKIEFKEFDMTNKDSYKNELNFNGKLPSSGSAQINEKGQIAIAVNNGKYCALKDFDSKTIEIRLYKDEECNYDAFSTPAQCFNYETSEAITDYDLNKHECIVFFGDYNDITYDINKEKCIPYFSDWEDVSFDFNHEKCVTFLRDEWGVDDESISQVCDNNGEGLHYIIEEGVSLDDLNEIINYGVISNFSYIQKPNGICSGGEDEWGDTLENLINDKWNKDEFINYGIITNFSPKENSIGICNGGSLDGKTLDDYIIENPELNEELVSNNVIKNIVYEEAVTITKFKHSECDTNKVVIPAKIDGFPVVTLGENSLRACQDCGEDPRYDSSYYYKSNVEYLDFSKATNLKYIGANVANHETVSFPWYSYTETKMIHEVVFGENSNVKKIGPNAFAYNQLTSLTIPSSVKTIEYSVFSNNQIKSLVIPSSVEIVGNSAFINNQLTSLIIKNGVISIGAHSFSDNQISGNLIIPDSVNKIGDSAFYKNQLSGLTLPNNLTTIGESAFYNNQIKSLAIPSSVEIVGSSAFSSNQLTSLTIPSSVKTIDGFAFSGNQLTSLVIPSSVEIVGSSAFSSNQLTSLTIENGVKTIEGVAFAGNQLTSLIIPDSVTTIGYSAFYKNQLSELTLSNNLTTIEQNAFRDNQLKSVTIPNRVTEIGYDAFSNNQIQSVTIPNSVKYIGGSAFEYNNITQGNFKIDNTNGKVTIQSGALNNNGSDRSTTITPTYLR